jgi:hypothetical protein
MLTQEAYFSSLYLETAVLLLAKGVQVDNIQFLFLL